VGLGASGKLFDMDWADTQDVGNAEACHDMDRP
jgi:hypothetical protein